MIPITITVSGPGGLIGQEVQLVALMLQDLGYNVSVEDKYPDPLVSPYPREAHFKTIKVVADHCPWGG